MRRPLTNGHQDHEDKKNRALFSPVAKFMPWVVGDAGDRSGEAPALIPIRRALYSEIARSPSCGRRE